MEKNQHIFSFKSFVVLVGDVFENLLKVSLGEFNKIPLYCVSLRGWTRHCDLNYTNMKLQTVEAKYMIRLLKNNIRRVRSLNG